MSAAPTGGTVQGPNGTHWGIDGGHSIENLPLVHGRIARRQLAEAILALLAERWPRTFFPHAAWRPPLKVGIHEELCAALNGALTDRELYGALWWYTHSGPYLHGLRAGKPRVGLDGEPAGTVTADEAERARRTLIERRYGKRRSSR